MATSHNDINSRLQRTIWAVALGFYEESNFVSTSKKLKALKDQSIVDGRMILRDRNHGYTVQPGKSISHLLLY